jgi:hypothetical protein
MNNVDLERLAGWVADYDRNTKMLNRIAELNNPTADAADETPEHMKSQLTREDLNGMTPEQIEAAHDAGDLDQVLGRINPADRELIHRATNGQRITHAEAKRLHEIGQSELVANLPTTNITKDNA